MTTVENAPKLITTIAPKASGRLPVRRILACRPSGQEALIRDPDAGTVHFLNPAAVVIWECCDGKVSIETCASLLREKFEIPTDINVVDDIYETVADFSSKGLLEECFEERASI